MRPHESRLRTGAAQRRWMDGARKPESRQRRRRSTGHCWSDKRGRRLSSAPPRSTPPQTDNDSRPPAEPCGTKSPISWRWWCGRLIRCCLATWHLGLRQRVLPLPGSLPMRVRMFLDPCEQRDYLRFHTRKPRTPLEIETGLCCRARRNCCVWRW